MKEVVQVMKRYELKYRLTKEQVEFFKTKVLDHMKVDKYGLTTISSLYYDTPNYSLINRSIEKPLFKEKIRLRSYGIAKEDSPVFLEIKRKNEKIVYKRRIATVEDKAERFFEGAEATMPEGGGMELEINGYSNGDAGAVVSSYVLSADEIQAQGYPEHTGAYIGFYVNGTSALYITVTDFDDDAHGIEMYQTFCDTMGIMDALPE